MISSSYTVSTTPTLIAAADPRKTRMVYIDPGANDTYLGGLAVNSTIGIKATKNEIYVFLLRSGTDLYAVTSTGSHTIKVMESFR